MNLGKAGRQHCEKNYSEEAKMKSLKKLFVEVLGG